MVDNKTTTFSEFIKSKAVEDRLAFNIDFKLLSVDSDETFKVGKYELAKIDELTVVESWFFGIVSEQIAAKSREFSLTVNNLAASLISHMGLDCARQEAASFLVQCPEEWLNDEKYLTWCNANASELDNFNSLYQQTQNSYLLDMLMVTLAMIVRYDTTWNMGKTASLGTKTLAAIKAFLIEEANGGYNSDNEEPTSEEGEEDEAGKE